MSTLVFGGGWSFVTALPAGSGSSPPTPTPAAGTKIPLSPNFTAGPVGLDPYRPWSVAILDGEFFLANGWDQPRRWDRTLNAWAYMGAVAPTTFAIADAAAGATFPAGRVVRYRLVFANSTLDKESAPDPGAVTYTMIGTKNITITWDDADPSWDVDQDVVRIYRATDGTDDFLFVAAVAKATETYTDSSTDATLIAAAVPYIETFRDTLPEIATFLAESQGVAFYAVAGSESLRYSQGVRVDSRFVFDDFPDANLLPVGAGEGTGEPRAMVPYYGSDIVFKLRATYEKTGSDILNWTCQRLGGDRGTFNPRTVIELDGRFLALDPVGVYWFTPGVEPIVAGAPPDSRHSPFQPLFDRMNISAGNTFHAVHLKAERIAIFYVALDFEPLPNIGVVFDYGANRFVGFDVARWSSAAGILEDAQRVQHVLRGCDMGYLWEDDYGNSEGVFTGTTSATATTGAGLALGATGAAFDTTVIAGAPGAPLRKRNAAGTVVDENRVYAATSTTLTLYYYPTTEFVTADTLKIGVIPLVIESDFLAFRTHDQKQVKALKLEFESVSASILVGSAVDNATAFTAAGASPLSLADRTSEIVYFTAADWGWTWAFQIAQDDAGPGLILRAVHVHYYITPGKIT